MTLQEMSTEVWEQLGEPQDMIPGTLDTNGLLTYDVTSTGGAKLLGWLNRAQARVLSWKDPVSGEMVRFRDLEERLFFQGYEVTGTAQTAATNTLTLESGSLTTDDVYNGMVVTIDSNTGSGQSRLITDFVGSSLVATVSKAWNTTPDVTSTYSINKEFYKFRESTDADVGRNILVSDKAKILTVTRLKDVDDGRELVYREKSETFVTSRDSAGTATVWYLEGDGLRFNIPPNDTRWFEANIRILPDDMTVVGDVPFVPEGFHEVMVLWCIWYGLRRDRNFSGAYSTKRDIIDLMRGLKSEYDLRYEEVDGHMEVVGYGFNSYME